MRKLMLAALAAISLLAPHTALAQALPVQGYGVQKISGGLTTTGDTVILPVFGTQWATVLFSSPSVGTTQVAAELTTDGTNWIASAYARRLNVVNANPTIIAFTSITLQSGHVWEVPLPANAVAFRLRAATTGTTTTVDVFSGLPYVPGNRIVAVLYDVTSGTAAALDTGTLDVSGWGSVLHDFTMNGGVPAFSVSEVDDAGTTLAALVTGTVAFSGGFGAAIAPGGTAGLVGPTASIPVPRRLRYQSAAIAAQTSRIRIIARR